MGRLRTAGCLGAALALAALAGGCGTTDSKIYLDGVWHQRSAEGDAPGAPWCKEDLILYPDGTFTMQQYECSGQGDTGTWEEWDGAIELDFDALPDRTGRVEGRTMTLRAPGFPRLVYLKK